MKNSIKFAIAFFSIGFLITSCGDNYPSLERYYVDSQASVNFFSVDIPASIVSLKAEDASSEEVKNTLKSIKKINFLGFQKNEENKAEFKIEQQKVIEILKNPKYQELMRLSDKGRTLVVKFVGDDDAIDQVIFYGADNDLGFAVARVLGNKMDPAKMMTLVNEVHIDQDSESFSQIGSFMKNMQK